MKIKISIMMTILLVVVLFIMLVMPALQRSDRQQYYEDSLILWHKHVLSFKDATGRLPGDLYEVYLFYKDQIDLKNFPIEYYRYLDRNKQEMLKKNPAYFLEITYYEYIQDGQHWFIKEKYPHNHGAIMFINELGEIALENKGTGTIEKVEKKKTRNSY